MAKINCLDQFGLDIGRISSLIVGLCFLVCFTLPSFGQEKPLVQEAEKKRPNPPQVADRRDDGDETTDRTAWIDPQKRREVLDFVNEHQPEIKRLLGLLENNRPGQYNIAFRSLVREVDRLKLIQQRSPARFDLSLAIWKNQKATDMLVAQTAIRSDNQRARDRLVKLFGERQRLLISQVDLDLEASKRRVAQLEEERARLNEVSDAEIESKVHQSMAQAKRTYQSNAAQSEANNSAKTESVDQAQRKKETNDPKAQAGGGE